MFTSSRTIWIYLTAAVFLLAAAGPVVAQPVPCDPCTVTVNDTSITYNPQITPGTFTGSDGFLYKSPGGLVTWYVKGANRVFAQGSFYRLGGATRESFPGSSPDEPATITATADQSAATIDVTYEPEVTPVKIEIKYILLPKIPGRESLVVRNVLVTNTSTTPVDMAWFDYSDFDLSPNGLYDDYIQSYLYAGTRVITQYGGGLYVMSQWIPTVQDGTYLYSQPAAFQLAPWASNPRAAYLNLLGNLLDNSITNLTSTPSLLNGYNDYTHAVQFNFVGIAHYVGMQMSSTMMLFGDVNGDGSVDLKDLNLITAARNQPASGPDDPMDLDHDGKITVLDARKLVLLCTRPGCAVQ